MNLKRIYRSTVKRPSWIFIVFLVIGTAATVLLVRVFIAKCKANNNQKDEVATTDKQSKPEQNQKDCRLTKNRKKENLDKLPKKKSTKKLKPTTKSDNEQDSSESLDTSTSDSSESEDSTKKLKKQKLKKSKLAQSTSDESSTGIKVKKRQSKTYYFPVPQYPMHVPFNHSQYQTQAPLNNSQYHSGASLFQPYNIPQPFTSYNPSPFHIQGVAIAPATK